jgi:EAL domain-containing protein (putative c-di-GMP-specific phosphodiesterase class I)
MSSLNSTDLSKILENKMIETHYQPVVSIIKKAVIGFEGLSRGQIDGDSDLIPHLELFKQASKDKRTIELDRICREKALENFVDIHLKSKDLLLFINIDTSIMTEDIVGSGVMINLVKKLNLKPENMVIEIAESKIRDEEALTRFIQNYRSYGFLIALDGVGSGRSNLDRIIIAKPDIIKIDRIIVKNMHLDYYKQEVFKALVGLAKTIGSLVVAEGIETEEEAIKAVELGADMLQGYYFAIPQIIQPTSIKNFNVPVRKLATSYYTYLSEKINTQKLRHKEYSNIIKEVLNDLSQHEEKRFDYELLEIVNKYKFFECLYILDPTGVQVTDTVTHFIQMSKHKNLIFRPAKKGEDHSLKKYYYFLRNMKLSRYLTEPYISLASGNLCVTMSNVFKNVEGKKFILCVDMNPEYLL